MENTHHLKNQIKVVINLLNSNYINEINSGLFQLLYKRYSDALEILEKDRNVDQINIVGGVRAYMDNYSDYENPLLGEMHEAEKLTKELI
ncbi:hypothetical protein QUF56_07930 [Ureibacillus composti]|nr:hypothetical protein [Ureibacillus composti]